MSRNWAPNLKNKCLGLLHHALYFGNCFDVCARTENWFSLNFSLWQGEKERERERERERESGIICVAKCNLMRVVVTASCSVFMIHDQPRHLRQLIKKNHGMDGIAFRRNRQTQTVDHTIDHWYRQSFAPQVGKENKAKKRRMFCFCFLFTPYRLWRILRKANRWRSENCKIMRGWSSSWRWTNSFLCEISPFLWINSPPEQWVLCQLYSEWVHRQANDRISRWTPEKDWSIESSCMQKPKEPCERHTRISLNAKWILQIGVLRSAYIVFFCPTEKKVAWHRREQHACMHYIWNVAEGVPHPAVGQNRFVIPPLQFSERYPPFVSLCTFIARFHLSVSVFMQWGSWCLVSL